MKCNKCGNENRDGRKFCGGCGEELTIKCPDCGFSNSAQDKFCGGCANPVYFAQSAKASSQMPGEKHSQPSGELRQVTIMFADLAGYTRLSTEKDPEEIHHILSRFFEYADGALHSYGGRVDKHIGDAVMGVFGAPVAHGNDPERAVRAAIEIHESMKDLSEEIGTRLEVHIGIASGQVVASGLGSSAHQEYTVTGESVNLASRLSEMA